MQLLRRGSLVLLAVLACAACGSDGSATSAPDSETSAAALSEAKSVVAQYSERPTALPVTDPIGKPVPAGKRVVWIECGVPLCKEMAGYVDEAAKALGWTSQSISTDGSPESIQAAWKQAVRMKPDGVLASGFGKEIFGQQLAELQAANIPVAELSVPDEPGDGIVYTNDNAEFEALTGKIQAAAATVATDGRPNAVYVDVPGFAILRPTLESYKSSFRRFAPGGKLDVITVALQDIGKNVPDKIVGYLRAHPDVNVVALSQGSLGIGLPAAIKAAGLGDRVKVLGATPGVENLQYVSTGDQYSSTTFAVKEGVWMLVDALARHMVGAPMGSSDLPIMYVTKDNLVSASDLFPAVADYQEQFKRLWGRG
jgi:ribose transport system substrate-binding protein